MNEICPEHYHCLVCENPYLTIEQADNCFKNHNETEHLRWIAREVCCLKSYTYDLMKQIDFIEKKYNLFNWEIKNVKE